MLADEQETDSDERRQKTRTASEWKDIGNDYFKKTDYAKAVEAYESGIEALTSSSSSSSTDDDAVVATALRTNLAMVLIKLEDFQRAEQECTSILQEDPKNTKGKVNRRGQFREKYGETWMRFK